MTTRGPQNIFSGEPLPVAPEVDNPEIDAFNRKLLDYLRRLTGKLARFGGGSTSALKAIALYFTVDQSDFVTGIKILEWSNVIRQDSDTFQFSAPSTDITVLSAGDYVIEIDIRVLKNVPHEIYVKINGTVLAYGKIRFVPSGDDSYSYMIPVTLNANDVINITIDSSSIFATSAYADGTRLLITKI